MSRLLTKHTAAAVVALLAMSCRGADDYSLAQLPTVSVDVVEESLSLRVSEIGFKGQAKSATTVLVDVRNPLTVPVEVELAGSLESGGTKVGDLYPDSLRVPAGGLRTFALVHHPGVVDAMATASIEPRSVRVDRFVSPVLVKDGHVYEDDNRVVVAANIENTADREGVAVVIAGFYDKEGRILQRPFTTLRLQPKMIRPVRFVGPPGSTTAYIFVGETRY